MVKLDTQPLIEQLWRPESGSILPVLHPFSAGNLLFLHYHTQRTGCESSENHRAEAGCADVPLSQLDVLITPWWRLMNRASVLGMGGVLTRTLQNWQQYGLQPVGYAHDCRW